MVRSSAKWLPYLAFGAVHKVLGDRRDGLRCMYYYDELQRALHLKQVRPFDRLPRSLWCCVGPLW